eukprot:CAMPEP_0170491868 /NCGR_PEP_ID=MMETSP0208-20121228/11299_1 /TAXON_ID=197538 /ORGANISM="Strombidium inclinatum, Strain S3" /LENGTH=151 /DNA_ID=CAMNT_0010767513 /DNA_START=237 /DNA_END=692 /DNA_ORIENTATION=+
MTSVTTVDTTDTFNATFHSNYSMSTSTTKVPKMQFRQNSDGVKIPEQLVANVYLGQKSFYGHLYTEQMCLVKDTSNNETEDMTLETGGLCTSKQDVVMVYDIMQDEEDPFEANGIVGLAPSAGVRSIINTLYNTKAIQEELIGINLEDPSN